MSTVKENKNILIMYIYTYYIFINNIRFLTACNLQIVLRLRRLTADLSDEPKKCTLHF